MSKSIHSPWIKEAVHALLAETPGSENFAKPYRVWGTRCVQILAIDKDARSLTISDTDVYVHAFLTKECFEDLFKVHSIDTLKFCQANLVDFCISTVTQAAGDLDVEVLRKSNVLFPLALHCFKVIFLGASDCTVIGNPTALNADKSIAVALRKFKYYELKQRLGLAQFPLQKTLPDWERTFEAPEETDWKPTKAHFAIPDSQVRILEALNSLDICHTARALPGLLLDEYGDERVPEPGDGTKKGQPNTKKSKASTSHQNGVEGGTGGKNDEAQQSWSGINRPHTAADGWEETWREDFDNLDFERMNQPHFWHTQIETQVDNGNEGEGDGTLQDADFPSSDSEADDHNQLRGAGSRRRDGGGRSSEMQLLSAPTPRSPEGTGTGTGTQVVPSEIQVDLEGGTQLDGTLQESQASQSLPLATPTTSPLKTRQGRKRTAQGQSGDESSVASTPSRSRVRTPSGASKPPPASASARQQPFPTPSPGRPPAIPKRGRGKAHSQLETLSEGDEGAPEADEELRRTAQTAPLSEQEERVLALYDKLARATELQPHRTAVVRTPLINGGAVTATAPVHDSAAGGSHSQLSATSSLPRSSATQASPVSHLSATQQQTNFASAERLGQNEPLSTQDSVGPLTQPQYSGEGSSSSLSGPSLSGGTGSGADNLGWLDRAPLSQNLFTLEDRDTMFDYISSQPPAKFLFPLPATNTDTRVPASSGSIASSSSAVKTTTTRAFQPDTQAAADARVIVPTGIALSADAFVCEEVEPAPTSTVASAGGTTSPGLFHTQASDSHTASNHLATPSRPTKAPIPPSQTQSQPPLQQPSQQQHHQQQQQQQQQQQHQQPPSSSASASYRSPSSQSAQVVMINQNDSAPNQMMTKSGKLLTFPPPSSAKRSEEALALVRRRVRVRTEDGVLDGVIEAYDGRVFHVLFDNGEREAMDLEDAKRCLVAERPPSQHSSVEQSTASQVRGSASAVSAPSASSGTVQQDSRPPGRPRMTSSEAFLYCASDNEDAHRTSATTSAAGNATTTGLLALATVTAAATSVVGVGAEARARGAAAAPGKRGIASVHHATDADGANTTARTGTGSRVDGGGGRSTAPRGCAQIATAAPGLTTPPAGAAALVTPAATVPLPALLTEEQVAAMSDTELLTYFRAITLPHDFRMPPLSAYGYNVYAMLRALPALLRAHQDSAEQRRSVEQRRQQTRQNQHHQQQQHQQQQQQQQQGRSRPHNGAHVAADHEDDAGDDQNQGYWDDLSLTQVGSYRGSHGGRNSSSSGAAAGAKRVPGDQVQPSEEEAKRARRGEARHQPQLPSGKAQTGRRKNGGD